MQVTIKEIKQAWHLDLQNSFLRNAESILVLKWFSPSPVQKKESETLDLESNKNHEKLEREQSFEKCWVIPQNIFLFMVALRAVQ